MGHQIKTVFELLNTVFIFYNDNELSPSGKATDFDSVIPWVRIPPAQPKPKVVAPSGGYLISSAVLKTFALIASR